MTLRTNSTAGDLDSSGDLDVSAIVADFPILARKVHDRRLVFLDSAASSQRPRQVLDAMDHYYTTSHANVHRAAYTLAEEATNALEHARGAVARFIGAPSADEIVFTKNATESINLVARSWGAANLGPGDAVLLSQLEHHANIVPWQQLAAERGFEIRWIPLTDDAQLDLTDLDELLDGVKLLSITAMSNVVGVIPPIRELADRAHAAARWCVSMRASTCPTCRPTSASSERTSSRSPATSCAAPPVSACCGRGATCSMPCRRSSAAAG